ncbi:hypothetical protein CN602_23360 [Bacillus cereus]|uniref:DUF6602 domain-containing protein n=1 Tax=Bacillus cereus TaxID=1396 RepID=UPI000BEF2A72|nr:DUF6602 domain-containing protein [Bacillus cereus]PEL97813.1 hypothetical protein CN602_23360 [Bacillus cereus]
MENYNINSYHDLLIALKNKGIEEVEPLLLKIKHPRVTGDAYEDITNELLTTSLFKDFDLRVVKGFIKDSEGKTSDELDCMIVEGDGQPVRSTGYYLYPVERVIAVIQVKKNVYGKDVKEGYENLNSVYSIAEPHQNFSFRMLEDSYASLFGEEIPPYKEVIKYPLHKQMIYHCLLKEAYLPLRIIFGFNGYKSEFTLRKGFIDYLEENMDKYGYGPVNFPNLIICGDYSLIKLDGYPFNGAIKDDFWVFYGSYHRDPLLLMLEQIWTRLTYKYEIDDNVFGEDLLMQAIKPLIKGKCIEVEKKTGWIFDYFNYTQSELKEMSIDFVDWKPYLINQRQQKFFEVLFFYSGKIPKNELTGEFYNKIVSKDELEALLQTEIVGYNYQEDIVLLNYGVLLVPFRQNYLIGNNRDGRMERWLNKKRDWIQRGIKKN